MQENEKVNIQISVQARNLFHTLTMRRAMRIFRFAKRNSCNFYLTLGSKEWTEITITTTENEIWELVNVIKGSMKLSFLHKQIKKSKKNE